jgi:DNA-binding PucR family transcriptional regulator
MLADALSGTTAVLGLTVPTEHGSDSIRWARQALRLAGEGVIPGAPGLIDCADHLTTLWLLSDPQLTAQIAERELAPLDSLSGRRRDRLIETLRVHITTRAPAEQVGETLGVHAQTVRYRLRNLDTRFGDQLDDPERRFALEAALRALHLRGDDYAD